MAIPLYSRARCSTSSVARIPSLGAKAVLRAHRDAIVDVDVDDPGVAGDIDTPTDYEQLVNGPAGSMRRRKGILMKRSVFAIVTLALVAAVASRYSTIAGQSNGSASRNSSDWAAYGHDPGGQRFSPLTQLTPDNVNSLQVAWAYHMRPRPGGAARICGRAGQGRGGGRGASGFSSSETTPIVVDGLMYLTTPYGRVVALDSSSGREVWNFKVPADDPSTRGVAYWARRRRHRCADRVWHGPRSVVFAEREDRRTESEVRRQRKRRLEHAGDPAGTSRVATGSAPRRRCIAT